jgi:Holin of 3TMs, for gene-transfer release
VTLSITDILGGSAATAVKGIIEEFHLSPAEKAQFQAAVDANAAVVQQKQIEYQEKLEDSYQHELDDASANIRAEAQSGDRYTSRARPSYIYVTLWILLGNYFLFPLIGKQPVTFPDALFWLFGSCILGYTGARSWDKQAATNATKGN